MLKSLLQRKNLKFILLISIILVLLVIVSNLYPSMEGYVNYRYALQPNSTTVIKLYHPTKNLSKLFDSFYYDTDNANVIIVNGTDRLSAAPYSDGRASVTNDSSENLISSLWVYDRNPNTSPAVLQQSSGTPKTQTSESSKKTSIDSLKSSMTLVSPESTEIIYVSWGQNTYLISLDCAANSGNVSFENYYYYSGSVSSGNTASRMDLSFAPTTATNSTYVDKAGTDGTLAMAGQYSKTKIYQITNDMYYDYRNGNIVLLEIDTNNSNNNKTYVLKRKTETKIYSYTDWDLSYNTGAPETERADITLTYSNSNVPYIVQPKQSNVVAFVWPTQANTMIATIHKTPQEQQFGQGVTAKRYNLYSAARFTTSGIDAASTTPTATPPATDASANKDASGVDQNVLDAFTKWYMYWNNYYDKNTAENGYSDDYLLKTQIVPPVCPSCPSCSSGTGVCTSCGGQGGSGTQSSGGGSLADVKGPSSAIASVAQTGGNAYGQTLDTLKSAGSGASDLVKDVGTGALVAGAVGAGAVGAAGSQVYSDVRSAGSTVYGDIKGGIGSVAGGVGNVVSGIGSGVKTMFEPRFGYQQSYGGPTAQTASQYGYVPTQNYMTQSGTYNQGRYDQFSYGGASPSKGSNFIPLTTDFSSFSK